MEQVELLPTNKRLKQVIKEFGNPWNVLKRGPMVCFGGKEGIQIESLDGKHMRNVEPTDIKPA